jgi:hypothetical protein
MNSFVKDNIHTNWLYIAVDFLPAGYPEVPFQPAGFIHFVKIRKEYTTLVIISGLSS